VISIADVSKSFHTLEVLKDIQLNVDQGEVVSLIGASGSGKSTLLQCINGLEPIQKGHIEVDGIEVHASRTNLNELRQHVGIVFQQYNIFPHLTAIENVMLALRVVLRLGRREAAERAHEEIARFGLADKRDTYPDNLSGGQQQRLALARALAMRPRYLLLDEITSALDPELVNEVLDALRMLQKDGMTMLLVTHEIRFAREISDRVAFFCGGKVWEIGPPAEVIDRPQREATQRFLRSVR
jgi:polar amino acid transport system ATP-binding protein